MASSKPKKRFKPESQDSPNPNKSQYSYPSHSLILPSKSDFLRLVAVVAIAASVTVFCNSVANFFNSHPRPFCDSDTDFLDSVSDLCEPCPSDGVCHEGKLECAQGYRKYGKLCVEDGNINEIAKKLETSVEAHVCESYAQYLCGGTGAVWVRRDQVWNDIDSVKLMDYYGADNIIYARAKQRAMEAVGKLLETRESSFGITELKCPDVLVEHYKPLACHIRQWIVAHILVIVPSCALLLGCTWMLLKVRRRHYLSTRAEQLYEKVCEVLEENALISRSVNGEGEPWVVASWLRDHLLLPRERKDPELWKKVEELVQEDSRLDRYPKMVKGESKVVWEWQVEGSLRSSGKKSRERSKQKSNGGTNLQPNQHHEEMKFGEVLNF